MKAPKNRPSKLAWLLALATAAIPGLASATSNAVAEHLHVELAATDRAANYTLGSSVASVGGIVLAGAPNATVGNNAGAGAVYLFNGRTGATLGRITSPHPHSADAFGTSVAACGDYIVVGAPYDDTCGKDAGTVFVYDTKSRKLKYKIHSPQAADDDHFGSAVAVNGDFVLVGSPQDDGNGIDAGAAYLYYTPNGNDLARLVASTTMAGDAFGSSVAVSGNLALIGAPNADVDYIPTTYTDAGEAYTFDLVDNLAPLQLHQFAQSAVTIANDDHYGYSVALEGHKVFIGAPGDDNIGGTDAGSVHLYNAATDIETWTRTGPWSGGKLGTAVALCGHLGVAGAPLAPSAALEPGAGRLVVYETTNSSNVVADLEASGANDYDFLGTAVAIDGDLVVGGAPYDDADGFPETGAAIAFREIRPSVQNTAIAEVLRRYSQSPDVPNAYIAGLLGACVDYVSEVSVNGNMTGSGINASNNEGIWLTQTSGIDLVDRTGRTLFPTAVKSADLKYLTSNAQRTPAWISQLRGPGVTASNDAALLTGQPGTPTVLLREGAVVINSDVAATLGKPRQANQNPHISIPLTLKIGTAGVTATNDSALFDTGSSTYTAREGDVSTTGALYGQFINRVARPETSNIAWTSFLQSSSTTNQAIFSTLNGAITRRGTSAPGTGGVFSTFLGEAMNKTTAHTVWRATVSGPGINASNNEGIWSDRSGFPDLVVKEGSLAFGLNDPDYKFTRFIAFGIDDSDHVFLWAQIRGPGVNTSNDTGLWIIEGNNDPELLVREGDFIPGCGCACIGTILRVDFHHSGHYIFQATLVGGNFAGPTAATNVALFSGRTIAGLPGEVVRRQPTVLFRKGARWDRAGAENISSLSIPADSVDVGGGLSTGVCHSINVSGDAAVQVGFQDGNAAIWKTPVQP